MNNNNTFEFYYSKYLCSLLVINGEVDCESDFINNYNFFYEVKYFRRNINLLIDIQKTLIENIFIVMGIIPFLKYNSTINYKINNRGSKELSKILFTYKQVKNDTIILDINDLQIIKDKFNELINYIWEILPKKFVLDSIRFILQNYYDKSCLLTFEKALYKNYKYYINRKSNKLNVLEKDELLSK